MTGPGLSRRVERAEEDLTAVTDTVLEIKDTVDRHTDILAAHGRELAAIRKTQAGQDEVLTSHGETLAQQSEVLTSHGETLAQQSEMLAQQSEMLTLHGEMLTGQSEVLAHHGEVLAEILRRLDAR